MRRKYEKIILIYVAADIKEDKKFTEKNLHVVQPENRASPWLLQEVIDNRAHQNHSARTPLNLA